MDVILLERVEKLGQMGEVVKVKPGYARNYLLPQRKALRATKDNIARFETERTHLEATNLERRSEAETVSGKLAGFSCVLLRQASETAQLYGSVSARDIADAAGETGVTITRDQVLLDRPIKTLGIHAIRIALHPEVIVAIRINVARSLEEAEGQARTGVAATGEPAEEEDEREDGGEPAVEAVAEAAGDEAPGEDQNPADGEDSRDEAKPPAPE
jgi:large subunit ribosomal protein L9